MSELPTTAVGTPFATSEEARDSFFGGHEDLLPLWIAEPYLPLAAPIVEAIRGRAAEGWYGYEVRTGETFDAFGGWMERRHRWDVSGHRTLPSPSIGTSMGLVIDLVSNDGDGVVLQPPVFTDFKPLVQRSSRQVARNPLVLDDGRYVMDTDHLAEIAAGDDVRAMIVCNPHNPIGRAWTVDELREVAEVCAEHDVFVIADEIHADLALPPHRFTAFAVAAEGTGVRWAAVHGPIKTFGLAGVCETLLITDDEDVATHFAAATRRLHLARKHVFGQAAWRAGYEHGDEWLDGLLETIASNVATLQRDLPEPLGIIEPEATYLGWLDLRGLGLDVPELTEWLTASARLALSPGHWFGREGAGFARMSIGVEPPVIADAIERLTLGVSG